MIWVAAPRAIRRSSRLQRLVDAFWGLERLPLMTVHRSKGLEYDTVLFLGLDDQSWWSHRRGDQEGLATFFVALSRAKQRAIFTFSQERGGQQGVADLYELLASAGVSEVDHRCPVSG